MPRGSRSRPWRSVPRSASRIRFRPAARGFTPRSPACGRSSTCARGPLPLLFLFDELFNGTNSHDRCVGAEGVVRGLIDLGAIGLVTTHDLVLAQIADKLAPQVVNVHFEDRLEDGKMLFDYRMRPGVVQHSNALALDACDRAGGVTLSIQLRLLPGAVP